jgi:hypothetical protein
MKIAAFDIIDTEKYLNAILKLNSTDPLNENFDKLGFNSMRFLNNLGSMLLGFIIYFLLIVLLYILGPFMRFSVKLAEFYCSLRESLFYETIVSMITESYSILAVCCFIQFCDFNFDSPGEYVQNISMLMFFAVLVVFPIFITRHTVKYWHQVEELKQQYHGFFEELRIRTGPIILIYNNYFMLRRFILAACVVFLRQMFFLQFMLKAFSIIAAVIIDGQFDVFETRSKLMFELFNEVMIMMILYTVVSFSSFVPDVQAKEKMGYICCIIVALQVAVSLQIIIRTTIAGAIFKVRLLLHRRKLVAQKAKNREILKGRKRRERK